MSAPDPNDDPLARLADAKFGADGEDRWIIFASWTFKLVGIVCMIGGIALVFSDPGGLLLLPFGAAFFGAGYLSDKIFSTPRARSAF